MSSVEEILAGYEGLQAGQEAFYKDLHQHPELSHQEHRTAQRVAGKLQEYGFTVHGDPAGAGNSRPSAAGRMSPTRLKIFNGRVTDLVTAGLACAVCRMHRSVRVAAGRTRLSVPAGRGAAGGCGFDGARTTR